MTYDGICLAEPFALDGLQAGVTKMGGKIKAGPGMMKQMMEMQGPGRMMNQPGPDVPR